MMNWSSLLLIAIAGTAFADQPVQHWFVSENNLTCLIVDAVPTITVKFDGESHTVLLNKTNSFAGNCSGIHDGQVAQFLAVGFFPNGITPASATDGQEWTLNLIFGSNSTIGAFQLIDYSVTTSPQSSINGSITRTFSKAPGAEADINSHDLNGFKCSTTNLALINESSIVLKEVRAIAFAKLDVTEFPKEQVFEQCLLDSRTSDIVPIIVGACLAGLVVVVLVAYLIGRARAKRQGYASV